MWHSPQPGSSPHRSPQYSQVDILHAPLRPWNRNSPNKKIAHAFFSATHMSVVIGLYIRIYIQTFPIWRVGSPYNGHTQLNCRISLGSAGQVCPCVAGNGSRLLMPNEDKLSCQTWTCRLRPENTNRCPRSMMTGSWGNWWRRGSTSALGNHKFSSLPNDLLTGRFIK